MKLPQPPSLDQRRERDFEAELTARAHTWIPDWALSNDGSDFGYALLKIASFFNAKVAERLDQCGDKMRRGFLDWLAMRGDAARPARMPVVFKMVDKAPAAVLALASARMQVDAQDASVVFETEEDVQVLPGRLEMVVATDADSDAIFLQTPGLTSVGPLEPLPTQWRLKSFAAAGSLKLQLDPEVGLATGMIVVVAGLQYQIGKVDKGIVTIDPALPVGPGVAAGTIVHKVTRFEPFDPQTRNRQNHAVYLGDLNLLNVEAAATIDVLDGRGLVPDAKWAYWGKIDGNDTVGWQPLPLAKKQPVDAVRLEKPKGAVEPRALGPVKNARWIAAFTATVPGDKPLLSVDSLELCINRRPDPACPIVNADPGATLSAQGLANTTPLTLNSVFYPLGRLPRQFDTFYIGCSEAFSKPGAHVQLCFELADATSSSLSAVQHGAFSDAVVAGVGLDRSLHLFALDAGQATIAPLFDREPLQPPSPTYIASVVASPSIPLDPNPKWRLPTWAVGPDFMVAATAGSHVWVWGENAADRKKSGWLDFGDLPKGLPKASPVDGLVYLGATGSPRLAALQDGKLYLRALNTGSTWSAVVTKAGASVVVLRAISPILVICAGRLAPSAVEGLVGVADNGMLYTVTTDGLCTALAATGLSTEVRPIALKHAGLTVVAATQSRDSLVAVKPDGTVTSKPLGGGANILGFSLEAALDDTDLACLASVRDGPESYLASWAPEATGAKGEIFRIDALAAAGRIGGAPTVIAQHVLIPGENADLLVAQFNLGRRVKLKGNIETGIIVPAGTPALAPADVITLGIGNSIRIGKIVGGATTFGNETFYPVDSPFNIGAVTRELLAYRISEGVGGIIASQKKLRLNSGDRGVAPNSTLLIKIGPNQNEYVVRSVDTPVDQPWVATLATEMTGENGDAATYWLPIRTGGRVKPFVRLDPTKANQKCDKSLLEHGSLVFSNVTPERQTAQAFGIAGAFATLVVMGENWSANPPGHNATFLLDAAVGAWSRQLGATASNPELSWEYWNGSWSKLMVEVDETLNLKATGAIRFSIPPDVAATDWAGKTNFWIRARLIGGDYGSENVKVIVRDLGGGKTEQTIERSFEGIQPPAVVNFGISYSICGSVMPEFVLVEDSGSIRDQSDANRTDGAIVEGFVPLAVTLGRLRSGDKIAATPPDEPCSPDCICANAAGAAGASGISPTIKARISPAVAPATGRALFLGFNTELSGASVNVLFVVDRESDHAKLAPLTVEALVGDRFLPVVSRDGTRALGETGILTLAFAQTPTQAELFGRTLAWLRLSPTAKDPSAAIGWKPSLKGVYLNATWARATETLTRELLGSSEGAPNLTLKLARPPVLRDTLELRVREPLGGEEREALRAADPESVQNDPDLPGDWALWRKVVDPADEGPTARVFALDESTGEIRFGDGRHGAIPPVGRDSIVAFRYQRTEPPAKGAIDVPANAIDARTQLNLVTPIAGVEAVFSADHAAGGAPPEPDERVLRFGSAKLRHRGRAVNVRDLEDLALASSPDIAQARALTDGARTRLVIVMRGKQASPNAAQCRELRRLLLGVAPFAFSAQDSLAVKGPSIRQLRIRLALRVDSLDRAGGVANATAERLRAFFDSAMGGVSKDGWPLGADPREDDVAFALIDLPHLVSITNITLVEALDDGSERPWTGPLKPTQLVRLADDGIRFEFESTEVVA